MQVFGGRWVDGVAKTFWAVLSSAFAAKLFRVSTMPSITLALSSFSASLRRSVCAAKTGSLSSWNRWWFGSNA